VGPQADLKAGNGSKKSGDDGEGELFSTFKDKGKAEVSDDEDLLVKKKQEGEKEESDSEEEIKVSKGNDMKKMMKLVKKIKPEGPF